MATSGPLEFWNCELWVTETEKYCLNIWMVKWYDSSSKLTFALAKITGVFFFGDFACKQLPPSFFASRRSQEARGSAQTALCRLSLKEGDGKGRSLLRVSSAPRTPSGMWSTSILGLIRMLLNAISVDQSARYRTLEKQVLWGGRPRRPRMNWFQM